ncbi:MAG: dihydropteroate synthase [Candidatus Omnitrophota bacterium]
MLIIGELINGMYPGIAKAILAKDKAAIQKVAKDQLFCGAGALDINCGPDSKNPLVDMRWLVETVQEVTNKPLCLDASNPKVIGEGLKAAKNKTIINSTTADNEKLDIFVPLAKKYESKLIGIAINEKGIPQNTDQRVQLAADIINYCQEYGFSIDDLYLDPIVLPINVAQEQLWGILKSIREFKILSDPSPKTVIGLSNISQGTSLSKRNLINRTFLIMAVACGLDSVILNPKDNELVDALITTELILNKNIYCDSYLEAFRKK